MSRRFLALAFLGLVAVAGCATPEGTTPAAAILPDAASTTGVFHLADGVVADAASVAGIPLAVGGQYTLPVSATEPSIATDAEGGVT